MKASELMQGNIVLYGYEGMKTIARVVEIYRDSVLVEDITGEYEPIEIAENLISPVEITPEILEKNGFKFDGSGQCSMMFLSEPRFSEGQRFNIYVGFKHKTIDVFVAHPIEKSPNWRKTNKAYLEVCGPYVHELQQAYKLCGIDKEIVL